MKLITTHLSISGRQTNKKIFEKINKKTILNNKDKVIFRDSVWTLFFQQSFLGYDFVLPNYRDMHRVIES